MRRPIFSLHSRRSLSMPARLAVALFALLQLIAPSWHVCELGGVCCMTPNKQCVKMAVWKPKCGGGPKCTCKRPPGTIFSPTGQLISAPDYDKFDGTCLARELMSLPGGMPVLFHFNVLITQRLTTVPAVPLPYSPTLISQPPARGPPPSLAI